MKYYYIRPEAVGELGDRTIVDMRYHPEIVTRLHWLVDWWNGDVLVSLYPCRIVTEAASKEIELAKLTGVRFAEVAVGPSEEYCERHPETKLPRFKWMKIHGVQGQDDFGVDQPFEKTDQEQVFDPRGFTLVISQRALDLLQRLGISHAEIEEYSRPNPPL